MKKQSETKDTWADVEDCDDYPTDEARRFVEDVRPYLIGKTLRQVLVHGFYFCGYKVLRKETYAEWEKRIQAETHTTCNHMDWEDPLIFDIEGEQLEFSFWQPNRYKLSLNKIAVEVVRETKGIPLRLYVDHAFPDNKQDFYDITCLYEENAAGQKVIGIDVVCGKYEDNMEYLESVDIVLENGVKLVVGLGLDSAFITVVEDA